MHIRLKITLLFTLIMFLLTSLLCAFIYYFFYSNRIVNIKAQLQNEAIATSRMLKNPGAYKQGIIIRAEHTVIKDKSVQAYNELNEKTYNYADKTADSFAITNELLDKAREENIISFTIGKKDAIGYYDKENNTVIFTTAYDEQGTVNLERLTILLCLGLISTVLIAFISGYFFSKMLLRPVRNIADEVNTISAQNLTHRIKPGNAIDEWSYLAKTLNELLNRLQESFEIQRRFIAAASHELSTPLTSISSQLEVALLRERSSAEYQQVMRSVYQDVQQLSKLTQTLLEFATVSGNPGGIELNLIRVDEVLLQLPGEVTKLNKGYTVKLEFGQLPEDESKLLVFGNAALLFTAIKNIVLNACKYSVSQLAKVKLSIEGEEIIIAVTDDGKGIPENEMQNIFQPFYRIDNNETDGFGVGLPLAKRIIKLHNGHININSVVGKGTTFFVLLPAAERYTK